MGATSINGDGECVCFDSFNYVSSRGHERERCFDQEYSYTCE